MGVGELAFALNKEKPYQKLRCSGGVIDPAVNGGNENNFDNGVCPAAFVGGVFVQGVSDVCVPVDSCDNSAGNCFANQDQCDKADFTPLPPAGGGGGVEGATYGKAGEEPPSDCSGVLHKITELIGGPGIVDRGWACCPEGAPEMKTTVSLSGGDCSGVGFTAQTNNYYCFSCVAGCAMRASYGDGESEPPSNCDGTIHNIVDIVGGIGEVKRGWACCPPGSASDLKKTIKIGIPLSCSGISYMDQNTNSHVCYECDCGAASSGSSNLNGGGQASP